MALDNDKALIEQGKNLKQLIHAYKDVLKSERRERNHWLGINSATTQGSNSSKISDYFVHWPAHFKADDSPDHDTYSQSPEEIYD